MTATNTSNIAFLRAVERPVHTLFVGPQLQSASGLFQRKVEAVRCEHVSDLTAACDVVISQAKQRPYDCVMVDMRRPQAEDADGVLQLAAMGCFGHLIVLANRDNTRSFEDVPGIDVVLEAPVEPIEIVKAIVASAPQPENLATRSGQVAGAPGQEVGQDTVEGLSHEQTASSPPLVPSQADLDGTAAVGGDSIQPNPVRQKSADWWSLRDRADEVRNKFSPKLSQLSALDQNVWRRFVPLASFLYKKLAIVLLSALFLTFVAYGAMIVFFMSNDNWSMPFELSRGHVLVEKAERDLSSLNLRRNELRQDLASATAELEIAERAQRDGLLQLQLTRGTLEQEIKSVTAERDDLLNQISRLNKIADEFKKFAGTKGFSKDLNRAYKRRLITKDELSRGTLSMLETMHRLATVDGEISSKRLVVQRHETNLRFLATLLQEIGQPHLKTVNPSNSEFAGFARQVIETKAQIAAAVTAHASAKLRTDQLEHSFKVISANLRSLEKTPAARALKAPVTVLFVPYDNVDSVEKGDPLYGCALTIFACSQVGQVGTAVDGESASVHPLFGKPMRGIFVEAEFDDPNSAKSELVHSGSSPLWL